MITTDLIKPVSIEDEMQKSYLDYAMSVIVSRALPDVRDGLKPVHRRILYAMYEGGYSWDKPFRKSARIVGDVMGKYHPHGDSAIYDAMVRMAQDFSMRLPLVAGQGNFGSMDGDPPAAMRYTEARLAKPAEVLLSDIDKNTVDFRPNYDDSDSEPTVLPAQFPNLLVNGGGGIAVGMATNIPPHNLGEVIDACCTYIDNPDCTIQDLMQHIIAPDFPTGGIILGRKGSRDALLTGRGSVIMRAKTHFEPLSKDKTAIIVTEIPYQVNKSRLMERLAEVVREKLVDGITDLRDESNRDGVRMVIELRRDVEPEIILNQLFSLTQLQTNFGVNTVALIDGIPQTLNVYQIIEAFIKFREQIITRRTIHDLGKAREKAHILLGLAVAVANIDDVIELIKKAPDPATARDQLMARDWQAEDVMPLVRLVDADTARDDGFYRLSEAQARAILELRLHRLTGLEREKIGNDLRDIVNLINELLSILGSREKLYSVMRAELVSVKERFATPRRTEISDDDGDINIEDLIQREDMVVTVSHTGYVKRVPLSTYKAQRRGGKGRAGMTTKEEDFVSRLFVASTHAPVLFFTNIGKAYRLKVYEIPVGSPQARGKAIVNLLPFDKDEKITSVMPLPEDETQWAQQSILFATSHGGIRRNNLSDFTNIKANGKIAMKFDDATERLIDVQPCQEPCDVFLATKFGKCIRFAIEDLRVFNSRTSTGVRGIKLAKGDEAVTMAILKRVDVTTDEREAYRAEMYRQRGAADAGDAPLDLGISPERFADLKAQEQLILTVTSLGYGKLTSSHEYRLTGRGGSGIAALERTTKNGDVVTAFPIDEKDQVMLVTNGGQLIRMPINQVRIAGRKTQGVMLFRIDKGEKVVSVAHLPESSEDDDASASEA